MATATFFTIADNAVTTLGADHTDSVTTITLASGGVAALGLTGTTSAVVTIIPLGVYQTASETSEQVLVTGESGDTLTGCTRGYAGSTATAFSTGDKVEIRVTKSHFDELRNAITDGTKGLSIAEMAMSGNITITKTTPAISLVSGAKSLDIVETSGGAARITTNGVGDTLALKADNAVDNLTLSGASGSELATFVGRTRIGAGTAALPSYSFAGDTNTGVYWVSADNLGFSTAGVLALTINSTQGTSFVGNMTILGNTTMDDSGVDEINLLINSNFNSNNSALRIQRKDTTTQYIDIGSYGQNQIKAVSGGARDFYITNSATSSSINIQATGSVILQTNGITTALTLDSSQNAAFIGSVTIARQVRYTNQATITTSWDISANPSVSQTMSANRVVNISNQTTNSNGVYTITFGGTLYTHTFTCTGGSIKWSGGVTPTWAINKTYVVSAYCYDGTNIYLSAIGEDI